MNMSENVTTLMKDVRARCSPCHAEATQSLKLLKEIGTLCVTNGKIIMGNAQTQTTMAMMSQATRFPATSHVQMTMSPTIIFAREAKPAVWVMSRVMSVPVYLTHSIAEGSSQRNAGVRRRLETKKMLRRTLMRHCFLASSRLLAFVNSSVGSTHR
jgi:hypothetical protein